MTTDHEAPDAGNEPDFDLGVDTSGLDAETEAEEMILRWAAEKDSVLTPDDIAALKDEIKIAEQQLEEVTANYHTQVARRALVFGFQTIAAEERVSSKQVHVWRKQYIPDAEDLSNVLTKIIPREQRRIEEETRSIEAALSFKAMMERRAAMLNKALEGEK